MISLHITLGLCHLMFVIKTGSSCGGNSALEVVEMCKGGSTTARHFYLHGTPAGDVRIQRCDCSLTITGTAGSVHITPVPLTGTTATCGGTLTLPNSVTVDCTRTSMIELFLYPGTSVVSFDYNTADVRRCMEVGFGASGTSINITCHGSTTHPNPTRSTATTTTMTSMSSPTTETTPETSPTASTTTTLPLLADNLTSTSASTQSATTPLSMSTSTTVPASAPRSTMTLLSENRSTSFVTQTKKATDYSKSGTTTVASHANTSFSVAAVAGGVGAGLFLLLVVVVVVVLCYRRGRHVDKQEEEKGPTNVITVTNSLYESSAATNNTQPTERLTIAEQPDNTPMGEGQLPLDLASEQQDGTPNIAKQQDGTPAAVEHRDGTSGIYTVVNKPKQSSEVRTVTKQSVHDHAASYVDPDFSKATKSVSPPPIEDKVIYAKVDKSSLKNKL